MVEVGTMLSLNISPLEDVVHVGCYLDAGIVRLALCITEYSTTYVQIHDLFFQLKKSSNKNVTKTP